MKREPQLQRLAAEDLFDILIIGGGSSGLACAWDAASRGYKTVLLERGDFAGATSSRSTKLIHGGVRYLRQANIRLVRESLRERERLLKSAPHLVEPLDFLLPCRTLLQLPWYTLGLKMYDAIRGHSRFADSQALGPDEALERLPGLKKEGLTGAVQYSDARFDDARLALDMAVAAHSYGGLCLNYFSARALNRDGDHFSCRAVDEISRTEYTLTAKAVINASGIFGGEWRSEQSRYTLKLSRGSHIVLEQDFLSQNHALIVPKTDDGRVLFAIPWQGRLIAGTTDVACDEPTQEPRPSDAEVEYILEHLREYLARPPQPSDILARFAGIRPLIAEHSGKATQAISRDHKIWHDKEGVLHMAGGKWTTCRQMAEEAVDKAIKATDLPRYAALTAKLALGEVDEDCNPALRCYGKNATLLKQWMEQDPALSEKLHPRLPYLKVQVVWALRKEMAQTPYDILARRTRALFLDAQAAMQSATEVIEIIAAEWGWSEDEKAKQKEQFKKQARIYLP